MVDAIEIQTIHIDALRKEIKSLRADNNSRQRSIEILGKAIGVVIPDFRASGTGEEHSVACAEELVRRVDQLRIEVKGLKERLAGVEEDCNDYSDAHDNVLKEISQLRAVIPELLNSLGYETCDICAFAYRFDPGDCVYADHVEAYEAITKAKKATEE